MIFKIKPSTILIRFAALSLASMMLCPNLSWADNSNDLNAPGNNYTVDTSKRLWNLQNADIQQVAAEVSKETGKNFLLDPRVSGKISIISSTPMSGDEVYQMFLSMLQVLGYTVVPSGSVNKIVPLAGSTSQNLPIATRGNPGEGAEMIVRVIPVAHVSASKLVPILRPLIPDTGGIAAYFPANALIITSTADNISHLIRVIDSLDQSDTSRIEVIPLQNSTASQVIATLNSMEPDTSDESHVTLAADDHSNSILMNGDMQGRAKMRALIARLDMPPPAGFEGNTQVFYLHYLKAAKIAPVLAKVAQADPSATTSGGKDASNPVSIQAEPTTNSLIITAPPAIMHNLQTVISQLDIRPAQVLVEAAIVEIDEGTLRQLGVQWGTINKEGGSSDNASSSGGAADSSSDDSGQLDVGGGQITRGSLPSGYNQGVGVIKSGNFREIITMLQQSQSTDILSTPSLVVLDNQTAKIEVGKTLSIQTGSYSNTDNTNSVTPFDTYDRQQIGLHLYVTPQINRGDAVQLKIDQGNETLQNPFDISTTPVTNNSSIKTTVLVNTGDILVLGGLISDNQLNGETKIPLLGDIPGVGKLFQYHNKANVKKNLMVFLKPIILYNQQNNVDITNGKYNFMRNQQINWNNGQPVQAVNTLPPAPAQTALPTPFSSPGMVNNPQ